jgi:hypothetical protein
MLRNVLHIRIGISLIAIWAVLAAPLTASAQDLLAVSTITGNSVFVFRSAAKAAKRYAPVSKPKRTRDQRLESVTKIKRQYDTIAKTTPKVNRAKIVDP